MKKIISLSFVTIFLFSSCATLFTGTKDTIHFNSNPQGAKYSLTELKSVKRLVQQMYKEVYLIN